MNLKRLALLAFGTYGLCALWAITGVQESSPMLTIAPKQTITLGDLSPQQLQDRTEALSAPTSTTSTTTTTTQPTTTVVPVPADTQ